MCGTDGADGASGGSCSKWRSDERAANGLLVIGKGAAGGGGTGVFPVFTVEMEPATQGGRPLAPAPCWSRVSLAQMPCVSFQKPSARCTETRALGWHLIRCRYPGPKKQSGMEEVRNRVTGFLACWQGPPHPWPQNEISFPNGPFAREFAAGWNSLSSAEPFREGSLRPARWGRQMFLSSPPTA